MAGGRRPRAVPRQERNSNHHPQVPRVPDMLASLIQRAVRTCTAALALAIVFGSLPAGAQFSTPGRTQAPPPASPPQDAPPSRQAPAPAAPRAREPAPPAAPPAFLNQPVERIAAVVNDEIISLSDLEARVRLAVVSSGLTDSPEARQRLAPQVLRTLIDERLQVQEAKRLNISVTDKEIDEALAQLAQQNRMSGEQLVQMLEQRAVPVSTLRSQIRATISWTKLVQRRLRPAVEIGDEEVDQVVQRIQANAGKPEYLVAQIFLAVDRPDQDEEVRRLAERLVEQISQGASFPAVARQFSQSADSATGGDIGWVQSGQLPDELDDRISELRVGQMSRPIRSVSGYHILLLRDQRTVMAGNPADVRVNLKQVFLPREAGGDDAGLRARAEAMRSELAGCEAMDAKATTVGTGVSGDLGTVSVGELPPQIAQVVQSLPVGEPSQPLLNERGALVLMVCSREVPASSEPPRDEIVQMLGSQRLDMLQRRLLRDLRQAAFVDVRV